MTTSLAPVPSNAASFSSIASSPFAPAAPPLACAPRSSATIAAPCVSAANKVPSGANASGPMEPNVGPSPARVICSAEDGDNEARTIRASTSPSFCGEKLHSAGSFQEVGVNATPAAKRRQSLDRHTPTSLRLRTLLRAADPPRAALLATRRRAIRPRPLIRECSRHRAAAASTADRTYSSLPRAFRSQSG